MTNPDKAKAEEFLSGIRTEFGRLRRIAFLGGFFFLPITERARASGYWSYRVFTSMVMSWDSTTGEKPWWLGMVSDFQKSLRAAEFKQLDAVSKASITGLTASFACFIALACMIAAAVGATQHGYVVLAALATMLAWFPLGLWLSRRLEREIERIEGRIETMVAAIVAPPGSISPESDTADGGKHPSGVEIEAERT
jgi:hypothetical protein